MTKTQVKENKSKDIKELRKSDFSVTKFEKDLSYGKKHEKLVMIERLIKQEMYTLSLNQEIKIVVYELVNLIRGYLKL